MNADAATDRGSGVSIPMKLWPVVVGAALLRLFAVRASAPTDDAFITFRYAHNLAHGLGFVFNEGERVLGTTTPLFTLLLTPLAAVGLPLPEVSGFLAIVFDCLTVTTIYYLLERDAGAPAAWIAATAYATSYASIVACGFGMETQFFMMWVVLAFALWRRDRTHAAAFAAGMAILTRPEGLFVAGILGVAALAAGRPWRRHLGALMVVVAVVLPWVAFATVYFGSPLPNSAVAKSVQGSIDAARWWEFFVARNPLVMLVWLGALGALVWSATSRRPAVWLLGGWLLIYPAFFLVGRPSFLGAWYFAPLTLALWPLAGLFVHGLLERWFKTPRMALSVGLTLWLLMVGASLPRALGTTRWFAQVVDEVYEPLAAFVDEQAAIGDVIHASDIGYLGYRTQRRLLDAAALVSPMVWQYYLDHADDPNRDVLLVLRENPDWVVLPVKNGIHSRFEASPFSQRYQALRRFQVEGETALPPFDDPSERYAQDGRYMADFIVYRRVATEPR